MQCNNTTIALFSLTASSRDFFLQLKRNTCARSAVLKPLLPCWLAGNGFKEDQVMTSCPRHHLRTHNRNRLQKVDYQLSADVSLAVFQTTKVVDGRVNAQNIPEFVCRYTWRRFTNQHSLSFSFLRSINQEKRAVARLTTFISGLRPALCSDVAIFHSCDREPTTVVSSVFTPPTRDY